jgi:hypothetical protein
LQSQHRKADSEYLAGAQVAMRLFGVAEVFVEGFHKRSYQLSAVSFQLNIALAKQIAGGWDGSREIFLSA